MSDSPLRLQAQNSGEPQDTPAQQEIKRAAQLSLAEISLGSIGHGFKIPLTGQVLSLNQLGFLLNAMNRDHLPRSSVFEISSIAAVLKSFSPAGQKLGPMLSIAMQGFLFWISLALFGAGWVGQIIGAVLLSMWAFIQPFITLFFIFGPDLFKLIDHYQERMSDDFSFIATSVLTAFTLVLSCKLVLALILVVLSRLFRQELKFVSADRAARLVMGQVSRPSTSPLQGALRDLTRPLFLLSFILMMIFFWQMNGSWAQKIWMSLRPLAIAFTLFYILRSPKVSEKLLYWSKKSPRFNRIYSKAQASYEIINTRFKA